MNLRNASNLEGQSLGQFIFECFMSILYLLFGIIFLATPLFGFIQGWVRIALGILLSIYGIFRIFRAIRKIIRKNE